MCRDWMVIHITIKISGRAHVNVKLLEMSYIPCVLTFCISYEYHAAHFRILSHPLADILISVSLYAILLGSDVEYLRGDFYSCAHRAH